MGKGNNWNIGNMCFHKNPIRVMYMGLQDIYAITTNKNCIRISCQKGFRLIAGAVKYLIAGAVKKIRLICDLLLQFPIVWYKI